MALILDDEYMQSFYQCELKYYIVRQFRKMMKERISFAKVLGKSKTSMRNSCQPRTLEDFMNCYFQYGPDGFDYCLSFKHYATMSHSQHFNNDQNHLESWINSQAKPKQRQTAKKQIPVELTKFLPQEERKSMGSKAARENLKLSQLCKAYGDSNLQDSRESNSSNKLVWKFSSKQSIRQSTPQASFKGIALKQSINTDHQVHILEQEQPVKTNKIEIEKEKTEEEEMLLSYQSDVPVQNNVPLQCSEGGLQESGVGYSFSEQFNNVSHSMPKEESKLENIQEIKSQQDAEEKNIEYPQVTQNIISSKCIKSIQSVTYLKNYTQPTVVDENPSQQEEKDAPEEGQRIKQSHRYQSQQISDQYARQANKNGLQLESNLNIQNEEVNQTKQKYQKLKEVIEPHHIQIFAEQRQIPEEQNIKKEEQIQQKVEVIEEMTKGSQIKVRYEIEKQKQFITNNTKDPILDKLKQNSKIQIQDILVKKMEEQSHICSKLSNQEISQQALIRQEEEKNILKDNIEVQVDINELKQTPQEKVLSNTGEKGQLKAQKIEDSTTEIVNSQSLKIEIQKNEAIQNLQVLQEPLKQIQSEQKNDISTLNPIEPEIPIQQQGQKAHEQKQGDIEPLQYKLQVKEHKENEEDPIERIREQNVEKEKETEKNHDLEQQEQIGIQNKQETLKMSIFCEKQSLIKSWNEPEAEKKEVKDQSILQNKKQNNKNSMNILEESLKAPNGKGKEVEKTVKFQEKAEETDEFQFDL